MAVGHDDVWDKVYQAQLRQIFLTEWDPIGIKDLPGAQDEYDHYADETYYKIMNDGATADMIAAYLEVIAADHMSLGENAQRTETSRTVAKRLVELHESSEVASRKAELP